MFGVTNHLTNYFYVFILTYMNLLIVLFSLFIVLLLGLIGFQSYLMFKTIDLLSRTNDDKVVTFPELTPDNLSKDPDMVPYEELPDTELKEAMAKTLEEGVE